MLSEKSIESLGAHVLKFPSRMFQIDFPDLQAFTSEGSSLRFCDGFWKCFVTVKCTFFQILSNPLNTSHMQRELPLHKSEIRPPTRQSPRGKILLQSANP